MSQLGRISGQLLKDNLTRNGHDLTFDDDLLHLDVTNRRIGIKTTTPNNELDVNGTTRTTDLEVTNQADLADLTFSTDTITSNTGTLNLTNGTGDQINYQAKLVIDNIDVENNVISTNGTNTNLELRPNGTGSVEVFANTNVYGNIYASGDIRADGNITVGDANTDSITINADVSSNIIPDATDTYTLGSSSNRWLDLWVKNIYADAIDTGEAIIDGVTLNLTQGNIYYVAANGDDTNAGEHQNDPFATIKHALSVAVSGDQIFIYPGTYEEIFPLTVPVGVTVKGAGIRSVKITPTTATRYNDAFLLNGESTVEDLTVADFFSGGNFYTVTSAAAGTTTFNVGTAPFAHTYVSGGTINISSTDYAVTGATYNHTTGDVTVTHAGPDATGLTIFLSSLTFSCNGGNRVFPDNGYAFRFATDFAVTTRSPYIRNVTVLTKGSVTSVSDPLGFDEGDAGKGAYIDGAYATASSKEASMLFHSVTLIVPNVDAVTATNGARIEWLNSFTYFANRGFYAYASNDGLAGAGLTRLKLPTATRTGTWAVGNTVSYYDTDGTTVLASGIVDSVDGDWVNLTGREEGFLIPTDRNPKTVTVNGNAKLATAEKKFGTASLALDGTTDYLTIASQADFQFGTGDFCLELFVYPTATGTYRTLFDLRTTGGDTGGIILGLSDIDALYFYYNGNYRIGPVGSVPTNTWSHIALARVSGTTRAFVNGTQVGLDYTDSNTYAARPVRIGADPSGNYAFTGYIDEIRISKGVGRYSSTFTPPTSQILSDTSTVLLLHFNGLNNSTNIVDDGVTFVDIRSSAGGTTTDLQVADYSDFGAEIRSIGSAAVYGNYGIYGDGTGVIGYFIGQNLAYIGNGKASTNDPNTVIQANEVVELNNAKIFYQSVDHKGDFRIGELFYVNQATGEVSFTNSDVTIGTSLTFDDGLGNITYLDATKIETGDFRISGNTVETLSQDFNVLSANDQINLQNNVAITGNLEVTGDVTVGGNVTIGDASTDTVQFIAGVDSDIIPSQDSTYDLGTSTERWANIFTSTLDSGNITISTNLIQTNSSNLDLRLEANGTGRIYIPNNNVEITQNLTVNGTTYLANTEIVGDVTHTGNVNHTGNVIQIGDIDLTGNLTTSGYAQFADIKIDSNTLTTTIGNNDLILDAAGTGKIYIPTSDVEITQDLTVTGNIDVGSLNVTTTISSLTLEAGDVKIQSNYITTLTGNNNLELRAAGTGKIYVPLNDVQVDNNLTVNGTTTLSTTNIGAAITPATITHVGDVVQTGDVEQTGNLEVVGTLTVDSTAQFEDIQIDNNIITTTISNNDLILEAAGTGKVSIPTNDAEVTGTLTVDGVTYSTTISNTGTVTSGTFTTGDISITTNNITTTQTNSNLVIEANGTGIISIPSNDVEITQDLTVNGTTTLSVPLGTALSVTGDISHTGNVTQTGDVDQIGDLTVTGTLDVGGTIQFEDIQINDNVITTTIGNNDLILEAAGSGKISIPLDNAEVSQTLTVLGTTSTTTINNTGTVTSGIFSTGTLRITTNNITTTVGNTDLVLEASGTGRIYIPSNDVTLGKTLTVNGNTTLVDTSITGTLVHVGSTTRTGDVVQTGNYTLNGNLDVSGAAQFKDVNITDNIITTTVGNNNLQLGAAGTGKITVPSNNVEIDNDLTVAGTAYTANINNSGTVTATTFTTSDISITGNTIQTTQTNSNLLLQANGTGFVVLEQFDIDGNEIRLNSGTDLTITPNGTGIVEVNSTQSIKIPVGATGDRPIVPTAGMIRFNSSLNRYEGYDGTTWTRIDGVSDADGNTYITAELTPGANDNTIRFVTNGTQVADLNSTRLNVNKVDIDSISIDNNTISTTTTNTDLIFSPNGTGALNIGNFAFRSNLITNTVNNSITYFNQTGDGYVKINSTGGFVIPVGETAERPALFEIGMMRYNTTDSRVEIWDGALWVGAGQGAGGGVTSAEAQDIGIVSAIIFG